MLLLLILVRVLPNYCHSRDANFLTYFFYFNEDQLQRKRVLGDHPHQGGGGGEEGAEKSKLLRK